MSDVEVRQPEALSPEQEREVKRLARLIERTDGNLIAFALFQHIEDKNHVVERLKTMLDMPLSNVPLAGDVLNPLEFLNGLPTTPRQVVNFTFVGSWRREADEPSELEKLTGYLNIQREGFGEQPHAAVFWLTEAGLHKVMTLAPDFWSWQSGGVFDFVGVFGEYIVQSEETLPTHVLSDMIMAQYRQAVKEAKETLGKDAAIHIKLIDDFAESLYKAGQYAEAEHLFRQAIEIDKTTLGEEHPSYARHLSNLALVLRQQASTTKPSDSTAKPSTSTKLPSVKGIQDYAISLNNLALVLRATGKYDEAERLYRQAIDIDKMTLGEGHPNYAIRLNNLAGVLRATGKYDEAERLYRQAIDIDKMTLGEGHPSYAIQPQQPCGCAQGNRQVRRSRAALPPSHRHRQNDPR